MCATGSASAELPVTFDTGKAVALNAARDPKDSFTELTFTMTWHGIRGHDAIVERFRRAIGRRRLASSFLFAGPAGIGKRSFALKLAQAMLCQERPEADLDPCETCPSCAMVLAGTHPDLDVVSKAADKSELPVATFLGDREHRGREGMCHRIGLRPFMGKRKIAVIDDADFLNTESANCLLKTLEEPPPSSVLILIGTSPAKQLPTIRSRCQLVRFDALENGVVAELLLANHVVTDPAEAERLARYAGGSVQRAVELAEPALWEFRHTLFASLAASSLESAVLARGISTFVEEAGKEASARRARLRQITAFAGDFYQHLLHAKLGAGLPDDAELRRFIEEAVDRWPGDAARAAACLERCLDVAEQIDRNANQTTLIEAWLDDLASMT